LAALESKMGRHKSPGKKKYNTTMTFHLNLADRDLVKLTASAVGLSGGEYIIQNLRKSLKRDRELVTAYFKKLESGSGE